jgi:hypothetical protein
LLLILHGLCGFPLGWRGEKTHWIVPFTYKGANCAIAHEKFGIRFYIEENDSLNPHEVLGKLQKAIASAEKHILSDLAQAQIEQGNITISNQFHKIESQYQYFREQAALAYAPSQNNNAAEKAFDSISDALNQSFVASSNGGFNTLAMIDAYFSRLEHFLVLALPFSNYDRKADSLVEFVGLIWSEKLRRIFDIREPCVQAFYDRLVHVKEKYRNTFAHGGFEKSGQSFFFHLPGFGAIPASMSGHRDSVHFNLFPIEKEGYEEICTLFDEFDSFLNKSLPATWRFAESGLNLVLAENNLSEMLNSSKDPTVFESWLEKESYLLDMYENADY